MTKLKIILLLFVSFSLSANELVSIPSGSTHQVIKSNELLNKHDHLSSAQFSPIQSNDANIAIDGFDPVAYFDQEQAVKGSAEFNCEYSNTTWHFSSAENRDKFLANPEKFVPQYGGYCAHSLTSDKIVVSDPELFVVRDDKLYLYSQKRAARKDVKIEDNIFNNKKDTRDGNWLTYQLNF